MAGSSSKSKWIVRGVVGLVLLAILIAAVIDNLAKKNAEGSSEAWIALMERDTDDPVLLSEIEAAMKGSPEVKIEEDKELGVVYRDYTWKGTFRSYRTRVTMFITSEYVSGIEGPFNE